MKLKTIKWQSKEYYESLSLRNQHLNSPSGLTLLTNAPINEQLAIHLVAVIDKKVVATLFLDHTDQLNVAQIKQVAVSDGYRGQKIGQSLMLYAELVARQQSYQCIVLNARQSACMFYEKLGYQPFNQPFIKKSLIMQPYFKQI